MQHRAPGQDDPEMSYLHNSPIPGVHLPFGTLFRDAVSFLDFPHQDIFSTGNHIQVRFSQPAPHTPRRPFQLFPPSFNPVPVHNHRSSFHDYRETAGQKIPPQPISGSARLRAPGSRSGQSPNHTPVTMLQPAIRSDNSFGHSRQSKANWFCLRTEPVLLPSDMRFTRPQCSRPRNSLL